MSQEQNLQMFQELMKVPHGDIAVALESHRKLRDKNPLFYAKMATWYMDNGTVRDHKVAFIRALFERKEEVYRDVAWALLQALPFQLVTQVVAEKNPRSLRSAIIHYLATMEEGELSYQILRGEGHPPSRPQIARSNQRQRQREPQDDWRGAVQQ